MEKDLVDYTYLSDNLRYADLLNGVLFGGEEVIFPEKLQGEDTKLVLSSTKKKKGRYRDVIKKYEGDVSYAVLGVENQEAVDYTMPFRIMEYEVGEYAKQIAEIKKKHETLEDVEGDEFLCKFCMLDQIAPCVTVVLYWGEHWDGPRTLKEMMQLHHFPKIFGDYVNDYAMHLISIREFEDTSVFRTDLKLVFDFMKYTKDQVGMRTLLQENEAYKSVPRDAYEVMRIHSNLKELDRVIEEKEQKKKEVVNMCQAIREIMEEEREKGIEQGIEQGIMQGILLQTYRMVERGRMTVMEALEDIKSGQTESDFLKGMLAAGFKIP